MSQRKCRSCNASIKETSIWCEYCEADPDAEPEEQPELDAPTNLLPPRRSCLSSDKSDYLLVDQDSLPVADSYFGSFGKRAVASIIDYFATTPLIVITSLIVTLIYPLFPQLVRVIAFPIVMAMPVFLYYTLFESSKFQATPGKMAVGLRVTDGNGNRLSILQAAWRTLAKYLSTISLMIGWLMPLWTKKHQALHDKIAGTYVANRKALETRDFPRLEY